jgi:hypothetical protein
MKWIILALFGAATACSTTTSEPRHATASGMESPKADFTSYRTFSFAPANPPAAGYEVTPRSLEVQRRLAALVQASLENRGYSESAEGSDLLIKISTGYGEMPGDKTQRGTPESPTPAGFIGIDAYDSRTGATVWHGSGMAEVDPERIDDALLARGVEQMLVDFPAPKTASNE